MTRSRLSQLLFVTGAGIAITMFGITSASASAAAVPKPSASCKVPVFSVSRTTATPGTKVTVSGKNFSGCAAQGSTAKPTAVLTVKVGVVTATKKGEVLATTKTSTDGSFSVQITVPAVPAGGAPKIGLAAESTDPATGLTYAGVAAIAYQAAPTTSASPTGPSSTSPTTPSTPVDPSSTSSVDVPTAVPAGSGGLGAPTDSSHLALEIGLGAAGAVLLGAGGTGLARRRKHQH